MQLKLGLTILLPCLTTVESTSYLLEALLLEGVEEVEVLLVQGEGEEAVEEEEEVQHQVQVVVGEEGALVQMMVGEEVVLHLSFVLHLLSHLASQECWNQGVMGQSTDQALHC